MVYNIDYRSKKVVERNLSNLHHSPFYYQGFQCGSIEGVLQGIKFRNVSEQARVFALYGFNAKQQGKPVKWEDLYIKDACLQRMSYMYEVFLNDLYYECFNQNPDRKQLLLDTHPHQLRHTIGHNNKSITVLTEKEFIFTLTTLREMWYREIFLGEI